MRSLDSVRRWSRSLKHEAYTNHPKRVPNGRDYYRRIANELKLNDIGHVELSLDRAIAALTYAQSHELGAFILIDKLSRATVAAGMIDGFPGQSATASDETIYWLADPADAERARLQLQHAGHPSFVLDEDAVREFRDGAPEDALRRIRAVATLMSRAGINVVMAIDVPVGEQWPGQPYTETEGPDEWVI